MTAKDEEIIPVVRSELHTIAGALILALPPSPGKEITKEIQKAFNLVKEIRERDPIPLAIIQVDGDGVPVLLTAQNVARNTGGAGLKTRCPKRILEGGIMGTVDLGICIDTCAAFELIDALNNNAGMCNEYHNTVNADRDRDQEQWIESSRKFAEPVCFKDKNIRPCKLAGSVCLTCGLLKRCEAKDQ